MMKKNHIFVIILISVVTASVVLISGYFKKAVYENNPDSEAFGIYTATLDGKNMKPLITNSWQQMSHARVSPDKKWVTFTRYTNRGKDGCATENEANYERKGEQYLGTEVLIMRLDGTDVRTLIPHQKDRFAANSYWTPDGKGIIYVSGPNEKGRPQINHIILDNDMNIKNISKIPIPENIIPTDPHWVGDWIVFPATEPVSKTRGIWRIKYNGEGLQQLTWPKIKVPMGDNDPKLSPDGSKVAFIRRVKEGPFFHVVVVDVNTKEERDFSSGYLPQEARAAADLPPEWSSDGKLLIFPHILVDGKKALSQMHTIKPDGTGRKRVPLPRNYVYFHTSFFPGEGSGKDTRIIFSTRKVGNLGKRHLDSEAAVSNGYEKINIIGEVNTSGIYDPSVEYNEDGSVGWMTYSSVDAPKYIRTNLAKTLDHGKTWTFVKTINSSVDGTVRLGNKVIDGSWWNEVSTLVHDPDDPGKEWKLFWHKYFAKHIPGAGAGNRVLQYGWIAYKYASEPSGKWSEEIPLFGARQFPLKPYNTSINLSELHPDLKDLFVYTEPGSIYKNGVLYLSLQGHKFINKKNIAKIILIASYDHGKTWRYIGTLLENEDAQKFGAKIFAASSLVEENGRLFLFATPEDPGRNMDEASDKGVVIFEFEDIKKGKLKEDNEGNLIDVKWIKTTTSLSGGQRGGQSDYDEQNSYGGIIMPQMNFTAYPEAFQIFNTKEKIVPDVETKCDEEFGLYTATLDGKNMKPLITNSWQQMTHARVSPDKKWVTFSRYTRIGKDGCATEVQTNYERKSEQYLGTEILIMRIDGTDLRVVVPARKFAAAVNSYWTPDGKGLVYTRGDGRKSRASHLIFDENMEIKSDTVIHVPEYLNPVVDPQWSGDWLVFPAVDHRNNTQGIWRMRLDGSMLEQLTARDPLLYDNDPKISPDGSKVAYSHKLNPEGAHYHFMMMDMNTKEETDLSMGTHMEDTILWIDIMPEWSSDGKLLVFWHAFPDVKNKRAKSVLHTISPDGTGRKEIPLPEGYNYQSPVFFPGEGSGKEARIIFSTRKIDNLGKK